MNDPDANKSRDQILSPYRLALGIDAALDDITKNKRILYDPAVVDACLSLFRDRGYRFDQL